VADVIHNTTIIKDLAQWVTAGLEARLAEL